MGCDIHVYIEKRIGKDSVWTADEGHHLEVEFEGSPDERVWVHECSAAGRDYELFGLLAGVRSYGDECLYQPRELPADLSEKVRLAAENWGMDGHSHTYLTLSEFTECVEKSGYKLGANKSSEAFYEWDGRKFSDLPESYTTIINYCNKWINDYKVDNILLNTQHEPEVRIVFWFDN
jgi:hypothetical protein